MQARSQKFVMAGLDPATQWSRVCAAARLCGCHNPTWYLSRADVRVLGGRVKPGQDEFRFGGIAQTLTPFAGQS